MGADFSDFDNDGRPDIVVTDLSNQRYLLFHNNGDGTFRDVTNQSGLGAATIAFPAGARTCSTTIMMAGRISSLRRDT